MRRKGLGVGSGKQGYYNMVLKDPYIHSLSAKGIKSYGNLNARTVVESFKVYNFDELPKDVQEKLIAENRDVDVMDTFWSKWIIGNFIEDSDKLGFEFDEKDVKWAIFDRASKVGVETNSLKVDIEKLVGKKNIDMLEKKYDAELDYNWNTRVVGSWTDYLGGGIASSKKTSSDNVFELKFIEYGGKKGDTIVPNSIKDKIKDEAYSKFDKFIKLSKNTFTELEDEYIFLTSDEHVTEWLKNNEFKSDGKIYYGSGQETLEEFNPKDLKPLKQKKLNKR